jgi:hypothetical protein
MRPELWTNYFDLKTRAASLRGASTGDCGHVHERDRDRAGRYVQPFALSCRGQCEEFLRTEPLWASTLPDLPESPDEAKERKNYELRG